MGVDTGIDSQKSPLTEFLALRKWAGSMKQRLGQGRAHSDHTGT